MAQVGKLDLTAIRLTTTSKKHRDNFIDLDKHYTRIDLYENIFENFITGTIGIEDSVNLPSNFGILGQEEVRIIFRGNNPFGLENCNTHPIDLKLLVHEITP